MPRRDHQRVVPLIPGRALRRVRRLGYNPGGQNPASVHLSDSVMSSFNERRPCTLTSCWGKGHAQRPSRGVFGAGLERDLFPVPATKTFLAGRGTLGMFDYMKRAAQLPSDICSCRDNTGSDEGPWEGYSDKPFTAITGRIHPSR